MKIKNLLKAAARIKMAVDNEERIILYGDADVDGSASVVILKETIEILGGKVSEIYFPDREKEGYGLNFQALDYLKRRVGVKALLIIMDSGISNFDEALYARKLGFELMIVDHHQPLNALPKASIIVNPKQEKDQYSFKEFSNTGLIFKLSEEILDEKMSDLIKDSFLELVALATMYDMMPQVGENVAMTRRGLESLPKTKRTGLKVFRGSKVFKKITSINEIAQKIISFLSAGRVDNHKTEAYLLFSSKSRKRSEEILKGLVAKNKKKIRDIGKIEAQVDNSLSGDEKIIFNGKETWDLPLLGTVASKVCQKTKKSVFLYKKGESESRGVVRTSSGINSVDLMEECSEYLKSFGGHPAASGFLVDNENIEKFKNCLIKNLGKITMKKD